MDFNRLLKTLIDFNRFFKHKLVSSIKSLHLIWCNRFLENLIGFNRLLEKLMDFNQFFKYELVFVD